MTRDDSGLGDKEEAEIGRNNTVNPRSRSS